MLNGVNKYVTLYLSFLVFYLVYISSSILNESGLGLLFFIPFHFAYILLNLVTVGLLVLTIIFKKSYIILVGTLWFSLWTVCHQLIASYLSVNTSFVVWAYLIILYGIICYIIYLIQNKRTKAI